jgi:hypothetical protein
MRHVTGVILAIAMAVALFFAASWGYLKLLAGRALPAAGGTVIHNHAIVEGFAALLAVGLLAGILVAAPAISPLAAGLPGLVLLAWTGLYLASTQRAVHYIPLRSHAYGAGFLILLADGVLAMAGLVMVIPLFVPSRWRRRRATSCAPYGSPADAYPDLLATQAMAGDSSLMDDWAATKPQPWVSPGPAQPPWGPAEPGPAAQGQPPESR